METEGGTKDIRTRSQEILFLRKKDPKPNIYDNSRLRERVYAHLFTFQKQI